MILEGHAKITKGKLFFVEDYPLGDYEYQRDYFKAEQRRRVFEVDESEYVKHTLGNPTVALLSKDKKYVFSGVFVSEGDRITGELENDKIINVIVK